MRVLLDGCVPRSLREQLPGHEVKTMMSQVLEAIPTAPRGKVTNVK